MSTNLSLLDLYKAILQTCWMTTDSAGNVYNRISTGADDEVKTYAIVDSKRLVLPTDAQLAKGDPDNKIVFHPLNESLMKGESLVVTKLRKSACVRINWTISQLVTTLVRIGASRAEHEKLSPNQSHILSALKEVDETTVNDVDTMVSRATTELQLGATFYSLYLKRGAVINGKNYARGGIANFPFYEELKKVQDRYYGVKLRKKDRLALLALFEFLLPGLDVPGTYSRGVDATFAPFMESLMRSIAVIGGAINDRVELYKNIIPEPDLCMIESDWEDAFNNLNSYQGQIQMIPPQAGNEGMEKRQDVLAREQSIQPGGYATPAPAPATMAVAPAPTAYTPQYRPGAPAPAPAQATNELSYADRVRRMQQQSAQPQPAYHQPAYAPAQPQVDPWGRPVIQQPPPGYQPATRPYGGYGGGNRL